MHASMTTINCYVCSYYPQLYTVDYMNAHIYILYERLFKFESGQYVYNYTCQLTTKIIRLILSAK